MFFAGAHYASRTVLQREGAVVFDLLVKQVSEELFQQEIDEGAWLLSTMISGGNSTAMCQNEQSKQSKT
jgi:hypothetical protein